MAKWLRTEGKDSLRLKAFAPMLTEIIHELDLFLIVLNSSLKLHYVKSQLVLLLLVGIFRQLLFIRTLFQD